MFDVAWYVARHGEEIGPNRDPFAHYLHAATYADIDPSPGFSAAAYRRAHLGRRSRGFRQLATPEKDNALVHFLIESYRRGVIARLAAAAGAGRHAAVSRCMGFFRRAPRGGG